jgi:hypothetical protein
LSPNGPSYRVYTPTDLQSIAPATFRSAPPPRTRGWFGFGFVIVVGVLISSASFGALRYFDVDLTNARTSLGAESPAAAPVAPALAPSAATPVATPPAAAQTPSSATGGAPSANTRRKTRGTRHSAPPPRAGILNLPRGPVVQHPVATPPAAPRPPPPPAAPLPPNPF